MPSETRPCAISVTVPHVGTASGKTASNGHFSLQNRIHPTSDVRHQAHHWHCLHDGCLWIKSHSPHAFHSKLRLCVGVVDWTVRFLSAHLRRPFRLAGCGGSVVGAPMGLIGGEASNIQATAGVGWHDSFQQIKP